MMSTTLIFKKVLYMLCMEIHISSFVLHVFGLETAHCGEHVHHVLALHGSNYFNFSRLFTQKFSLFGILFLKQIFFSLGLMTSLNNIELYNYCYITNSFITLNIVVRVVTYFLLTPLPLWVQVYALVRCRKVRSDFVDSI